MRKSRADRFAPRNFIECFAQIAVEHELRRIDAGCGLGDTKLNGCEVTHAIGATGDGAPCGPAAHVISKGLQRATRHAKRRRD
jgi:hypothetical protein